MELQNRRRDEVSAITAGLVRSFGLRSGKFVVALPVAFSVVYLPLLVVLTLSSEVERPALAWTGAAVALAAGGAARFMRFRRRFPGWAPGVLCAACFVALALLVVSLGARGYLLSILVLVPALWLAYSYLWRGAVVAVVATSALMVLVAASHGDEEPGLDGIYYVILPLLVLAMCSACVVITEGWEVQRSKLRAERTRLNGALAERNNTAAMLEAMLQSLDSAVVVFDAEGTLVLSNDTYLTSLSWSGEIGASERLVFDEDSTTPLPLSRYPSELARQGVSVDEQVMWFGLPGPRQRAVLATSRPIVAGDGSALGVMAIYHDITTMMRALQAKDDFVQTVSHELRTPLTSIIGYLELIIDDHDDGSVDLPDRVREHLRIVIRNADHLLDLVSDLLAVAQHESSSEKTPRVHADLNAIVDRCVQSAQPSFVAAGLTLMAETGVLPAALVNVRRITQVVDNVMSNALKYTPAGGAVKVMTQLRDGGVAIIVSDTGIGMSQADVERIFDKFHRAQTATTLKIPGIGLGLAISKSIVEAHGGTITVSSVLGVGTQVTVLLPTSW